MLRHLGNPYFLLNDLKSSIDNYEKWVIAYTKDLRLPMMVYTTLVNGVFAVLIAAALVMTSDGVTNESPSESDVLHYHYADYYTNPYKNHVCK